jgi:hypothetical protein
MCQVESKRVHRKSVKCYRVYKRTDTGLRSYYNAYDLQPIGKKIKAYGTPYHAFRSKKDVNAWYKFKKNIDVGATLYPFAVYECKLFKELESGMWDCNNACKTYTGNELIVIKEVGYGDDTNIVWNE